MPSDIIIDRFTLQRSDESFPIGMVSLYKSPLQSSATYKAFLHPAEVRYFESLSVQKAQYDYACGRYAAKCLAADYTGYRDLKNICIYPGVFGQPILKVPSFSNLQVSITHTDSLAMALIFPETHPMGIDAELITDEKADIISEIINPEELKMLSPFSDHIPAATVLLWTMKEALSKVMHTGLMTSFDLYEVNTIEYTLDIAIGSFKHFPQYKSFSWIADQYACSMALPKNSVADMHIISRIRANFTNKK